MDNNLDFLGEVEQGRKGVYKGLKGGLERFDKFTNNIQKSTYYLIGAAPKSGKTGFLDHRFVIQAYLQNPDAKINWIYFSYEISKLEKMAKFCAYFIRELYGDLVDSNIILSRGENKLSDELHEKVIHIYKDYVEPLFKRIQFYEDRENPTGIYFKLLEYAKKHGEFIYTPYTDDSGKERQKITGYKENDPELYTIVIADHIGLLSLEKGYDKKANIDKLSSYFVWMRNICKFTPVIVSQFNRDLGKVDRLKFNGESLQPTLEDFKDSSNTSEDASMVIAIFNAGLYPHIEKHLGYNIKEIGKGYRSLHILASRNTESGVNIGLHLEGETGRFSELPKP